MTDKSPLPPGLTEPDALEVRLLTLEKLLRALLAQASTDDVKAQAERMAPTLTEYNLANASDKEMLHRRAHEAASEILWDVWMAKEEANHIQAVFGDDVLADPDTDVQ